MLLEFAFLLNPWLRSTIARGLCVDLGAIAPPTVSPPPPTPPASNDVLDVAGGEEGKSWRGAAEVHVNAEVQCEDCGSNFMHLEWEKVSPARRRAGRMWVTPPPHRFRLLFVH